VERTVATSTLIVSIRLPWSLDRRCSVRSAGCLLPRLWPVTRR
jgi:hypothetical protein